MRYRFERSLYKLPIALLCCIGLLVGTSGVSFGNSSQTPEKQANFTLLPYDPSHGVTMTYFVINAHLGETVQQQLRITNVGNAAATARLTPVDATTGQAGGVVYLSSSQKQHNVGPWITMETSQVTLLPGQSEIVQFRVTVPTNVLTGQHVGGIVAQNMALQHTSNSKGNSNFQVVIQRLTIIPVEVQLPGPRIEQLTTKGIQIGGYGSRQTVNTSLQNTGNVIIEPHGTLEVMDRSGAILQKFAITMDTFLPHTSVNYPAYIQGKALGSGNYLASLTLYYGKGRVLHYNTTFTITQRQITQTFGAPSKLQTPWDSTSLPLWAIILIAVAALIVLFTIGKNVYALIAGRGRKKIDATNHPNRRAGDPGRQPNKDKIA